MPKKRSNKEFDEDVDDVFDWNEFYGVDSEEELEDAMDNDCREPD